jgi:hypothetical protein
MAQPSFAVTDDEELLTAVRAKTSYADSSDEWPGTYSSGSISDQAGENIDDAKRVLYARTGSTEWYADTAYGQALVAMAAMKAKEAVENINIERYGIGDETLAFSNADPESSQQIQSWSSEINEMLRQADVQFDNSQDLEFRNTSAYIG